MLLAIYLNDHLAGATVGAELSKRAAGSNEGSEYGAFLDELAKEIDEDRKSLLAIMRALGVRVDRLKVLGGWGGEKLGRLKPNGRLLEYSPLSRVIEAEGLIAGSHARKNLWRTLAAAAPGESRIADIDFVHQVQIHIKQRGSVSAL